MTAFDRGKPSPEPAAPPVWRRVFHLIAGAVLPVAGIFASWPVIVAAAGALAAASLSLDLLRLRSDPLNRLYLAWLRPFLKAEEGHRVTGASYMLVASFLAFLLLDQMVAVAALLFLAFGDPAAALAGQPAPGPRIFGKSPLGTAAFIGAGFLVVAALVGTGAVPYHWALPAGAVVAALAELVPLPLDDNLTIPLTSGLFMHFLMV